MSGLVIAGSGLELVDPSGANVTLGIGATLTERLDRPMVVRDITIKVGEDGARVFAWGTT
mgnify:CR=1 FL=1